MVAGFTANVCKELQGRDNASPITRRTINLDGIGEVRIRSILCLSTHTLPASEHLIIVHMNLYVWLYCLFFIVSVIGVRLGWNIQHCLSFYHIMQFLAPIAISPSVEPICSIDANVWREGSHLYKLAMSACEMLPPRESQSYLIAKCTATNICTEAVTLTIEPSGEPFNYEVTYYTQSM